MKSHKLIMAAVCALALAGAPGKPASADAEGQKAIIELLQVTGMSNQMDKMMSAMSVNISSMIKSQAPQLPDSAIEIFTEELQRGYKDNSSVLIAEMAKIYEKYYTPEEIRTLIAFYKTPTGNKSLDIMPKVMAEGIEIGQRWSRAVTPSAIERAKERLHAEGYKL